jgi:hypothetical protein
MLLIRMISLTVNHKYCYFAIFWVRALFRRLFSSLRPQNANICAWNRPIVTLVLLETNNLSLFCHFYFVSFSISMYANTLKLEPQSSQAVTDICEYLRRDSDFHHDRNFHGDYFDYTCSQ